jgi:hypothetical protein
MLFARDHIDMKWPTAAATYRRSLSEALTAVTVALLDNERDRPDPKVLRAALHRWAFNTARRDSPCTPEVRAALRWAERTSPPVSRLADPAVLRRVLTAISVRLDGAPGAASVVGKRRRVLYNIAEYAVERKCIDANPITTVKWKAPKASGEIDRHRW